MTLSGWLLSEEESLRKDCNQRDKNAVVAYSILPILESEPAGWNAVRGLPNSSAMFKDYLLDWHSQVEPVDKPFVNRVIQLLEATWNDTGIYNRTPGQFSPRAQQGPGT